MIEGAAERLATGMAFAEGPAWVASHGTLLFTDIPRSRIMAWREGRLEAWLEGARFAIGLALGRDGRLLACEHGARAVSAIEVRADGLPGTREVVAGSAGGRLLNSTNDVVAARDGSVLFTDPPYGVREEDGALVGYSQAMEQPHCGVWRATRDPTAPELLSGEVHRPNGLCLSPDERTLYVSDSSERFRKVVAFDVGAGWRLSGPRDLAVMPVGVPDGMRVDERGNLWVGGGDGVHVWSPGGEALAHVPVPEMVTNLEWGGEDGRDLFVTAVSSLYRVRTAVRSGRA